MSTPAGSAYVLHRITQLPFVEAVAQAREALRVEGFGVLTEVDVQATLREKLGEETEPYLILGACNPSYAHRALQAEQDLGALLPCNVVIYERAGVTHVAAVDPVAMLGIVANPALDDVDIRQRLGRAVESVGAGALA